MKVVFATYIDNQEQIKYPVAYLSSKINDLKVYASDAHNQMVLGFQGIPSFNIQKSILTPADIAQAQNKCIDHLFSISEADFVVWVQADIHITDRGHYAIQSFCNNPDNINNTTSLGLLHIKLFHLCGHSYFGVNIIGRGAWNAGIRYTEDGAYLGTGITDYSKQEDLTVDIGYLTIDQCRDHIRQHARTWNSTDRIHELPDREFVKSVLSRHDVGGLINPDSTYYKIIEDMGLVDQYNKVKEICQTL